jgi:predicted ATPase
MIREIRLSAFKRFDRLALRAAPVTVLTGINGGGKTTVIHALLLAQQASSGPSGPGSVLLNGPFGLELGEARDVLHVDSAITDPIVVEVRLEAGHEYRWELRANDDRSLTLEVAPSTSKPPAPFGEGPSHFTYLCAERLGPRDHHGVDSRAPNDLGVGTQGEYAAQVLATLDRRQVRPRRQHPRTAADGGTTTLRQQVEWWLSTIVRPVEVFAEWLPGSGITTLRFKTPGITAERTRPTNMGFGVSYALPIVIAALTAPAGGLLIVENPEAHLHPAGQSAMGAFLALAAADGVQVVVETHSDHVINGIRRAVVVERTLAPTDAVFHFFDADPSDGARVRTIEMRPHGDLSDWPTGFFDQLDTDLAALSRARRQRG